MVLTMVFCVVSTLAVPVEIGTSSPTISVATWLSVTTREGLDSTFTSVTECSALRTTLGLDCEPTRKLNPGRVWPRSAPTAEPAAPTTPVELTPPRPQRVRAGGVDQPGFAFLQVELDAVGQRVVERNLGDGGVDGDLQLRTVELGEGAQDELVVFVARKDQQRVARGVGGDADAFENRAAAPRAAASRAARFERIGVGAVRRSDRALKSRRSAAGAAGSAAPESRRRAGAATGSTGAAACSAAAQRQALGGRARRGRARRVE